MRNRLLILVFSLGLTTVLVKAQSTIKLSDFTSFMGIKRGDTFHKVKQLLGEPAETEILSDKIGFLYYPLSGDTEIIITYLVETGKVENIAIEEYDHSVIDFLNSRHLSETKLKVLDMNAAELIDLFGPSESSSSDFVYYSKEVELGLFFFENDVKVYKTINISWEWE